MPLDVHALEWDAGQPGARRGTLRVRFTSLADFKGAIARLHPGTAIADLQGHFQRFRLLDSGENEPSAFPTVVAIAVSEEPLTPDDPRQRMLLGNNFLQGNRWVEAISFVPPSVDGAEGELVVRCEDAESYHELRRFLDEPHGSSLAALDGSGRWYVGRTSDNGRPANAFPQTVLVKLRWLYLG